MRSRLIALDPLDQVSTRQVRALLWRDGQVVQQEEHTLQDRLYFRNELLDMLAQAGFHDVRVEADYVHQEATPDIGILIYIARKQGDETSSKRHNA